MHNDVKMTAHICDVRLSVVTSALQTSHFPCYCLVCIYVLDATKSADKLSISFRRICEIEISTKLLTKLESNIHEHFKMTNCLNSVNYISQLWRYLHPLSFSYLVCVKYTF